MTACARCGAPLDPDHACVEHEPGCDGEWCDCMNVCPECCRVLGCPLARQIPGQLTLDEAT